MADSTNAQIGSQTKLYFWDTSLSPDAYGQLVNVRQFGEIGSDSPEVDSTDLDSTGVQRIPGLPDGKEISILSVANSTTLPKIESIFDAGLNIDIKAVFPAPMSTTRYFAFTPLGFAINTVTPSGLIEVTLRGRISGSITTVDPHV